jgi:hypothetical protein
MKVALEWIRLVDNAPEARQVYEKPPRAGCWVYRQKLISAEPGSLPGSTAINGAVVEKDKAEFGATLTPVSGSKSAAT